MPIGFGSSRCAAMGGGGKKARSGKDMRKTRFKDPLKNPRNKIKEGTNAPPVEDEDMADIPSMIGGAFMPVGDAADAPGQIGGKLKLTNKQEKIAKKRKLQEVQEEGSKKRKQAPREASAGGTPGSSSSDPRQEMPKQKPGESAKAYAARVDAAAREQLREARRKVTTERQHERRRNHRAKKKKATVDRAQQKKPDADGLFARGESAKFGEVVERPPILSSAAMKSRSKLKDLKTKAKPDAAGGGKTSPAKADMASELADYASKVKAAYAAMKAKRLGG